MSEICTATVRADGTVTIPAKKRKVLGLEPGDELVLELRRLGECVA